MTSADRHATSDHAADDHAGSDRPREYRRIDYRAVRRSIPLSRVLELLHFRPTEKRSGNLRGCCVLCGDDQSARPAPPESSAKPTQVCFAANLSRNIWHCFRCRQGGDQLTLWSRANQTPLYAATKLLCQKIGLPIPWLN